MKIALSAVLLSALISPVRAEEKPAGGPNAEIRAERQEFREDMKSERKAFKEKQHEKRKAHRGKMKEMRKKARQERKDNKTEAAVSAPPAAVAP